MTSEALGFFHAGLDFPVRNGFLADDGEEGFFILQIFKGTDEFFILFEIKDNGFLFPLFIGYILSMSFHG